MNRINKFNIVRWLLYSLMGSVIIWQGYKILQEMRFQHTMDSLEPVIVNVKGNIKKPGYYRAPKGTNQFEILKVAGVQNTSDLSPLNLENQVEENQDLSVGTLETPVAIKASARLEFFFGDLTVLSADGIDRLPQEGMSIDEGDRVLTEENSQAELSVNTYSRIDMDSYSEITFDKFGVSPSGKNIIEIFQKNGICWYQISYSENDEQYSILTELSGITVGGRGANFTIDVKFSETTINVLDGLLLVERPNGDDAINLIAGQSVTIFNDNRPFKVTKLSPGTNLTNRFNKLTKAKADLIVKYMPFNLFFCTPPNVFLLISVQFTTSTVTVIQLPAHTSVSLFVQGFNTLQEAFLYGGVVFASTLVERIINTRLNKHIVFDKNDIMRTASSLGGLMLPVDKKVSSYLKIKTGVHRFKGQMLLDFLQPSVSGLKDSEKRQILVLRNIFEQIKSKNIIVTTLLADQILTNLETNVSSSEAMKHYNNFLERKNWVFRDIYLPITIKKEENKDIYEPVLEKSRKILLN